MGVCMHLYRVIIKCEEFQHSRKQKGHSERVSAKIWVGPGRHGLIQWRISLEG